MSNLSSHSGAGTSGSGGHGNRSFNPEFDLLFSNLSTIDNEQISSSMSCQQLQHSYNPSDMLINNTYSTAINNHQQQQQQNYNMNFNAIREVLSMLNGLNVEMIKKNPNDLFMLLKYRSNSGQNSNPNNNHGQNDIHLDDACCQMIIRIGGIGKILLKILNYLNYYTTASKENSLFAYPMFDDGVTESKTLGNIKQYFVNSIHLEIKEYHYHLLMIESRFRQLRVHYSFALRRIMLWSTQWLEKFLFIIDLLKQCIDYKGISLLNQIYDHSRNGDHNVQKMARSILHQSLKPFIFIMFDWLLYGEINSEKIGQDFFICIKDKSNILAEFPQPHRKSKKSSDSNDEEKTETFEWKSYELNMAMLPSFMCQRQIQKIFSIGNAIRLLRYTIKDEYDQKMVNEIFSSSQIQINYDIIRKFLYKNIETISECDRFFFEHGLVEDFDLLLESYYDVINDEMFKVLQMNKIKAEFELLLAYVLIQRGDFYESLIDYLLPLFRKPATEVINTIANGNSTSNLHRIFNMFMINSKLIDMHKVYKIDSLLYNNFELNENLVFTFTKNVQMIAHHLGWDCFIVRYTFSKNVYRVMFDAQLIRYERLFRQLFYYKRVLYSIRKAQHQIIFYRRDYRPKHPSQTRMESRNVRLIPADMIKVIIHMLNTLHFLFFHMFGFSSRMYRYFGQQIDTLWSTMFEVKFCEPQKNVEKFVYAHEKFLRSIERVIFFGENIELLTAYAALNDSIIDFCESFCEMEFFPTIVRLMTNDGYNYRNHDQTLMNKSKPRNHQQQQQLLQRQGLSEQLFKLQFKITVNISKYRCCIRKFIQLLQQPLQSSSSSSKCASNFEFKYDLLTYQPCLDSLFRLFSFIRHQSPVPEADDDDDSSIEFY